MVYFIYNNKKELYKEDSLGHNHEWADMYHTNEKGEWVKKEGWVFCWICGQEKEWKK